MIHLMCWLKGIREGKRTDSKVIPWWFHITISLAVREEQSLGLGLSYENYRLCRARVYTQGRSRVFFSRIVARTTPFTQLGSDQPIKEKILHPKVLPEHMSIVWMRLRRVMTLWGYTDDSSLSFVCLRSLGVCYAMLGHVELCPPKKDMFKSTYPWYLWIWS